MGRFSLRRPQAEASGDARDGSTRAGRQRQPWHERVRATASAGGQLPYVVEGFTEVSEAVRRGHPVLLRREAATVADGVTVFDETPPSAAAGRVSGSASSVAWAGVGAAGDVVTVQSFDVRTARFVLRDGASVVGELELTPRRLAAYLADPERAVGVALGG